MVALFLLVLFLALGHAMISPRETLNLRVEWRNLRQRTDLWSAVQMDMIQQQLHRAGLSVHPTPPPRHFAS